jgi:hypothetical protein
MVEIARSAQSSQPKVNPVRQRIRDLAEEYLQIRKSMPSGRERTLGMEGKIVEMRGLATEAWDFLPELMDSDQPGECLAAIAILQVKPAVNCVEWLGTHASPQREQPFVAYQAAVALRVAAQMLPPGDLAAVESSIAKALQRTPKSGDIDRNRTLDLALDEVQQRRASKDQSSRRRPKK